MMQAFLSFNACHFSLVGPASLFMIAYMSLRGLRLHAFLDAMRCSHYAVALHLSDAAAMNIAASSSGLTATGAMQPSGTYYT